MTSTSVREASSFLGSMAVPQTSQNKMEAPGFQQIWNTQVIKNVYDNPVQDNAAGAAKKQGVPGEQLQRGSSLKVKESQVTEEEPGGP